LPLSEIRVEHTNHQSNGTVPLVAEQLVAELRGDRAVGALSRRSRRKIVSIGSTRW